MTAGNKPAGGGKKPSAAPKASAADAAGGEQATAPAAAMDTALATYIASLAAVSAAIADLLAVVNGASAADRQRLRTEVGAVIQTSFGGDAEAQGTAFQAFLRGEDDDGELVEIEARSRDGKLFRRAGFEWTGDFRTVHVPADVADRLRVDPNLLVKGAANV